MVRLLWEQWRKKCFAQGPPGEKHGKKDRPWVRYLLSFFLPLGIFLAILFSQGIHPFGDRQILNYDAWHQYYPFLLRFWDLVRQEGVSLIDWETGLGTNVLSLFSYYAADPLNLILFLSPERSFRLTYTLLIGVRVGLAGVSMCFFLEKTTEKKSFAACFFSLGYAFCGFFAGYFWNSMWLIAAALFPLLCYAQIRLLREGAARCYVGMLALVLFSNYYIGWMCGVFLILNFFAMTLVDRVKISEFFRRGFRLLFCTLLGAGLAAVLLFPSFFALLNTSSVPQIHQITGNFYLSGMELTAPLAAFRSPTVIDGAPNLYTGAAVALLAFLFLISDQVSWRKRLAAAALVAILLLSMNYSPLNYLFHGFHYTNMIPYRFTFLFSFLLVAMGYGYFCCEGKGIRWIEIASGLLFSALVTVSVWNETSPASALLGGVLMGTVAVLISFSRRTPFFKRLCAAVLFLLLTLELSYGAYLGIRAVGTTSYGDYLEDETAKEIARLVESVEEYEAGRVDLYRMETTGWRTLNDSCLFGYAGISQFSSSANANAADFLKHLGMPADAASNRYVYSHGTPFADLLLGVRYLISTEGYLNEEGLRCLSSTEDFSTVLYRLENYLGVGFLTASDTGSFQFPDTDDPFQKQNALFRAMTGLEGDLFSPVSLSQEDSSALSVQNEEDRWYYQAKELSEGEVQRVLRLRYTLAKKGSVYAYAEITGTDYVQTQGRWHHLYGYPAIVSVGQYPAGETILLRAVLDDVTPGTQGEARFLLYQMDEALWQEGLSRLSDETLEIYRVENNALEGEILARENGYLYLSFPVETGAWRVFVDGEERESVPLAGEMLGIYLEKGEHQVRLVYRSRGWYGGLAVSLASLGLYLALIRRERRGKILFCERQRENEG